MGVSLLIQTYFGLTLQTMVQQQQCRKFEEGKECFSPSLLVPYVFL